MWGGGPWTPSRAPLPNYSAPVPQTGFRKLDGPSSPLSRPPHRPEASAVDMCIASCACANSGRDVLPVPCVLASVCAHRLCPSVAVRCLWAAFIVTSLVFFSHYGTSRTPAKLMPQVDGGRGQTPGRVRALCFPPRSTWVLIVAVTCTANHGVGGDNTASTVRTARVGALEPHQLRAGPAQGRECACAKAGSGPSRHLAWKVRVAPGRLAWAEPLQAL